MEARANGEGLRRGALTTLEAMVVSMGFMAPSVAMFFNTPFIAQFAGAAMPLAMLLSFAAVFLVALGFSQLAQRTASSSTCRLSAPLPPRAWSPICVSDPTTGARASAL